MPSGCVEKVGALSIKVAKTIKLALTTRDKAFKETLYAKAAKYNDRLGELTKTLLGTGLDESVVLCFMITTCTNALKEHVGEDIAAGAQATIELRAHRFIQTAKK